MTLIPRHNMKNLQGDHNMPEYSSRESYSIRYVRPHEPNFPYYGYMQGKQMPLLKAAPYGDERPFIPNQHFNFYQVNMPTNIRIPETIRMRPPSPQTDDPSPLLAFKKFSSGFSSLKVEDALFYLDVVKQKFYHKPNIYCQFLQVMRDFKGKKIDTECVVASIKRLFKDYPDLIFSFNTFLPPVYKIESAALQENERNLGINLKNFSETETAQQVSLIETEVVSSLQSQIEPQMLHNFASTTSQHHGSSTVENNIQQSNIAHYATASTPDTTNLEIMPSKQAIEYVSKIRNRYGDDSEEYRRFIDIITQAKSLQSPSDQLTSDNERNYYEVYQKVSKLFENYPDLIEGFTNFLPDNMPPFVDEKKRKIPAEDMPTKTQNSPPTYQIEEDFPVPLPRWFGETIMNSPFHDWDLLKPAIKDLSPQLSKHIIRCLCLFNLSYLSSQETSALLCQSLKNHPAIYDQIIRYITDNSNIQGIKHSNNVVPSSQTSQIDFHSSRRIGQSYWPLKPSYIPPQCSGRTELADSVLNDLYISQAILSEDTPYPGSKKPISLDIINRVEQERYELDMILHSTQSALSYLESKLSSIDQNHPSSIDLSDMSDYSSINCLKALQRIYGENVSLIQEGLKICPIDTLQTVIISLRSKEIEAINDKIRMNKQWGAEVKRNALKALDFQAPVFKNTDAKLFRAKYILRELDSKVLVSNFPDSYLCKNAFQLIKLALKRLVTVNRHERLKMTTYVQVFHQWVNNSSDFVSDEELTVQSSSLVATNHLFVTINIAVYLFLYGILCERLLVAKHLSIKNHDTLPYRRLVLSNRFDLGSELNDDKSINTDVFNRFHSCLLSLLDGTVDSEYYEDFCRCLFGLKSYKLFTLDKLVNGIVRQLTRISSEEANDNLNEFINMAQKYPLDLDTNEPTSPIEFMKFWNSKFETDNCCIIRVSRSSNSTQMIIRNFETGMGRDTSEMDESADEEWTEFVMNFFESDNSMSNTNIPFLKKNFKKGLRSRRSQNILLPVQNEENNPKEIKIDQNKAVIDYRLEADFILNSYKLKYLFGTTDVFYIKGSLSKSQKYFLSEAYSQKIDRFKLWWSSRLGLGSSSTQ